MEQCRRRGHDTRWVKAVHARGTRGIEGVTAGRHVVVVGLGQLFGHPRRMVYDAIVGLVGRSGVVEAFRP